MTILTPPKALREKLGEDGVDALIDLVNKANEKQKEDVLVFVGEKFEGKLAFLEEKFERRLTEVKSDLEVKLAQTESRIIKWMFIFWVGQIGVITGLLFAFFK